MRVMLIAAFLRAARREGLPLVVYRKMVADLYANAVSLVSTCACVLAGCLVPYVRTDQSAFLYSFAACLAATLLRCWVVMAYKKSDHASDKRRGTAAWEAAYALLCSWPFMLGLGTNAALALRSGDATSAMFGLVIVTAAVGSIAGRSSSRAGTTAQGAIIFAALPIVMAMLATRDPYLLVLAAMTIAHDVALISHSKTIQRSLRGGLVGHATIERLAATLRHQNTMFDGVLNNMSHGLCMIGADGKVAVANKRLEHISAHRSPFATRLPKRCFSPLPSSSAWRVTQPTGSPPSARSG